MVVKDVVVFGRQVCAHFAQGKAENFTTFFADTARREIPHLDFTLEAFSCASFLLLAAAYMQMRHPLLTRRAMLGL